MTGRLTIFFDGGCRPNPGPIETAVVMRGVAHFQNQLPAGDNNEAEWLALLRAAELAVGTGAQDALFVGDSALVIGQATQRLKCRSAQLRALHDAFKAATAGIARVRCRLVPRSKNLAGIALARRRDITRPPG